MTRHRDFLADSFFELPAVPLACSLLGKILWCKDKDGKTWRSCRIVETEAYTLADKASHAYRKRKGCEPMFAAAGTIYMYKIRQWDAFNISALGAGCAVLIKAAILTGPAIPDRRLSGQGLLCRALNLNATEWNGKSLGAGIGFSDADVPVEKVRVTPRLGVTGDKDWPYRFVEDRYAAYTSFSGIKSDWRQKGLVKVFDNALRAMHFAVCWKSSHETLRRVADSIN